MNVGFSGLGPVGAGIATNLLRAAHITTGGQPLQPSNPVISVTCRPALAVRIATWLGLSLLASIAQPAIAADRAADVDGGRIAAADRDPANWMTYGRTYSEQRFSPLSKITADNVNQLGLAWFADLDTNRGQEAARRLYRAPTRGFCPRPATERYQYADAHHCGAADARRDACDRCLVRCEANSREISFPSQDRETVQELLADPRSLLIEKNRSPRTRRTGASASGRTRPLHVARARSSSRPLIVRADPFRRSSRYHGLASVRNAADNRLRGAGTRM
jgi:hypothetical protein